ncbi:NAD(P)-dependent alcohol dehydrogenase [Actinoplanes couchii]|uniref:Oxidoreductase n=2 Tax=Actinoplanes couchii TaxID=403638 RepID=A0ABQ3XJD8_9ACTN|nr:oxidoreductase [Actinoplanes couchii]
MPAWRFGSVDHGLLLAEVPVPQPLAGEVVIDVRAAGMCHTDVGVVQGHLRPAAVPLTLGHEICGTVASIGAGVTGWAAGDRVAVLASSGGPGTGRDGGYASRVAVSTDLLVAVPEGVDDAAAAAATDAGLTAYHAMRVQGEIQPGMRVGVIGLGGLGMIGARLAVLAGAEVYAAELRESLYPAAAEQGVAACSSSITDFADKRLDLVVDFAGMETTRGAFHAVRAGGRIVQVGIGRPEATIDLLDVIAKQVQYRGSSTGTREDLAAFLDLLRRGEVRPHIEQIGFNEIGTGIQRLTRGEVTGRLVAVF